MTQRSVADKGLRVNIECGGLLVNGTLQALAELLLAGAEFGRARQGRGSMRLPVGERRFQKGQCLP